MSKVRRAAIRYGINRLGKIRGGVNFQEPGALVNQEIAASRDSRDIARGMLSALMLAPVDDRILLERGGGDYRVYEDTLRDDHVRAGVNQRAHGVIARPWEVQPGGKRSLDKSAAEFLRETLESLEWDRITLEMLSGVFYGFSVAEAMWSRDGRFISLQDIKVRNRRRFGFDGEAQLRMKTFADSMPGELMPDRKFWVARFGADHADAPYGLGLAHYLYWPVWLKRNALRFWAVDLEKFGSPTVVGKYPNGTLKPDQDKLLQACQAAQRDSAIVIPEGMLVELLEASRPGSAAHAEFKDAMNEAILMVCLGQTATAKGTSGALGSESERERVKDAILKADADVLSASFMRSIITWLIEWNFPGAKIPSVYRQFADEDLDKRIVRDEKICAMGFKPKLAYITDTYGGEWEEPAPEQSTPAPQPAAPPAQFAEPIARITADQQALEDLIAGVIPQGASALGDFGRKIDQVIARATSFDDLRIMLAQLLDEGDDLQDTLQQALVAADLHGRTLIANGE